MAGLDLAAAGLRPVATPRHARVLLVVGDLPSGLVEAAAVTYAQMPRPRAILAVGARDVFTLPTPDVTVSLDQASLADGVAALRATFAAGAWSPDAHAFNAEAVRPEDDDADESSHQGMDHGHMDHGDGGDQPGDHEMGGDPGHEGMDHGDSDDEMGHGGMDHGSMDHGGMDFMSMVAMTKDLPRDRDGLPMERIDAPFGPLFPGLPAGLCLTLTLDGDVVVSATASAEPMQRERFKALQGAAATFPARLARQQRLAPMAYWLLGRAALDRVADAELPDTVRRAYVAELERARATSHLGWVAEFAGLLGDGWFRDRAVVLQNEILRINDNDLNAVRDLRGEAVSLFAGFDRLGMVRRRLTGLAELNGTDASVPGPVGRAFGIVNDARSSDPVYLAFGFTPITRDDGDVYARLRLRLEEITQSLDLILAAGTMTTGSPPLPADLSGTGSATLETPRGTATLDLTVEAGQVTKADLTTPSPRLLDLVSAVTNEAEVADALIGVASLDLSPWEIVEAGDREE